MLEMSPLDTATVAVYAIAVIGIGVFAARRERAAQGTHRFFLAGSTLPWFAIGMSMIASSISTEQFVGEVGFAYQQGLAVCNWELLIFPSLTLMLFVFVPFYFRRRIATMPEYLERRYGPTARTTFAWFTVVSYAFINLAGVLYTGALLLNEAFGIDYKWSIVGLAVFAGSYTIYGGLAAVVWTDVLQGLLLIGGGLFVFVSGVLTVDGGFLGIIGADPQRSHLFLPASDPNLPWTAMLLLALSTNTWYYATNQFMIQRVLGAKSEWHARMGILLTAFLGVPLTLSVAFPGLIAHAINPALESSNQAYPFLLGRLVPAGLRGLILAGLLGAIMSSIDSLVNSTATVFTLDIFARWRSGSDERSLVMMGRVSSIVVLVIGAFCAPLVGLFKSIFSYFQEAWALVAAPCVVVFMLGLLWKRMTKEAAVILLASCFPLMGVPVCLKLLVRQGVMHYEINVLEMAVAVYLVCLILAVVISLATSPPPARAVAEATWKPHMLMLSPEQASTLRRWGIPVIWAVMILMYVVIYWRFW